MFMMEEKMASRKATDASIPVQQDTAGTSTPTSADGQSMTQLDQVVIPTVVTLHGCQAIQTEVNKQFRQLADLNESGKSKSHRGGTKLSGSKGKFPDLRILY